MIVGDKVYIAIHGREAKDDDYRANLACVYMRVNQEVWEVLAIGANSEIVVGSIASRETLADSAPDDAVVRFSFDRTAPKWRTYLKIPKGYYDASKENLEKKFGPEPIKTQYCVGDLVAYLQNESLNHGIVTKVNQKSVRLIGEGRDFRVKISNVIQLAGAA
jgi:hypothetical protein